MDFIIRQGKIIKIENDLYSTVKGVEYESLMKKLKEETNEKYDINDGTVSEQNKTILLTPGITYRDNRFDQQDISPYPSSKVPYSSGLIWSD